MPTTGNIFIIGHILQFVNKLNGTHHGYSTMFEWTALGPVPKHP